MVQKMDAYGFKNWRTMLGILRKDFVIWDSLSTVMKAALWYPSYSSILPRYRKSLWVLEWN